MIPTTTWLRPDTGYDGVVQVLVQDYNGAALPRLRLAAGRRQRQDRLLDSHRRPRRLVGHVNGPAVARTWSRWRSTCRRAGSSCRPRKSSSTPAITATPTSATTSPWCNSQPCPPAARACQIYTDSDEVGQTFQLMGYGEFGTGTTGEVFDTDDKKRETYNVFDATGAIARLHRRSNWLYDFDNGTAAERRLRRPLRHPQHGRGTGGSRQRGRFRPRRFRRPGH